MRNKKDMESAVKQKPKNKFGQYFTPEIVAEFMLGLANIPINAKILEPSCGEGVFLSLLKKQGYADITAYEIDKKLALGFEEVRYESFVAADISDKFDLVIGNPPYIRWANLEEELKQELQHNFLWNKHFNSLCDYLYIFILKSIELLKDGGQLIFICPEYWLNTTHSLSLRNYMVQNGFYEIVDIKTRNIGKSAQAPNIISAYKLAQICAKMIDNQEFNNFTIGYFEIDWQLENEKLVCKNAHYADLFQSSPAELYINWAAAMQIQFHVCDIDQYFKEAKEV